MLDVIVVWVGVYGFVSWWLLIVLLYFVSLCAYFVFYLGFSACTLWLFRSGCRGLGLGLFCCTG